MLILTKSDFIKLLQCRKYLWLYKHRRDLLPEDIDLSLEKVFEEGYEVEKYACELFPKGDGAVFQPTFKSPKQGIICRCDILKYTSPKEVELYEVKSSTEVKDYHLSDVVFQKQCLTESGLTVKKVCLILVNNKYVRHGPIEPKKLLKIEDVTEEVEERMEELPARIEEALKVLRLKTEPDVRILKQCSKPFACPLIPYCWKNVPTPSIYDAGLNEKKLNILLDKGILNMKDVPAGMITPSKRKFYESVLTDKPQIDRKAIAKWIEKLVYPLYFLDYETYSSAIPMCDGYRPYQQMPFQYSLHVIKKPGQKPLHYEHLELKAVDPVPALAAKLSKQLGPKGSVIAWNMGFEKDRNSEMAERLPAYAKFFNAVNKRMVDLAEPVKKGAYVHPDFLGKWSIKAVLPVMCPELSYEGLVTETATAFEYWPELISGKLPPAERGTMEKKMLAYCKMDTFGMVRILGEMEKTLGH
ncbi:DUF2779 domain-containing protein [Patescibacteria group bacterium]|nr:DUF2779 domain-containing protein [Patescibacteria group bacterium]MBU1016126.1 DUF2779 domain-containing protein [Patescibacteria group bacterium]MBU1684869.1 DUF2779 domain-containing protein [Patescibacteria group bacterium]MBU1938585.1 DUF2779 domain-containing protein [Patescibacteria group bacterium]